ncbi:hypothetical protein FA15DRAFT_706709 [Coprinopsis marcescibilis]|uniref:Uncharacterized protein n=1 Tax=Coprinopsis marcescibilis TaxID=230819 RepID=A0A5C3KPQ6_COPMA|nr:hypothetical protein FA15DRAFT_706709 [Coprinopsis marcescibilis]
MDLLHRVLRLLATGENAGHLLFERKSINPVQVRSLFVPRICRTMCLIGYNIPNEALHRRILTQMQPLKQLEAHSSYAQYWWATSWKDILRAIWNSTADSPLDDLVHLWATNRPKPLFPPPRRVTRVYFNRVVDISHLLSNRSPPPTSNVSGVKQVVHIAGPMHDSTQYAPGTVTTGDDRPSKDDQLEDDPFSTTPGSKMIQSDESVEVALSSDGLDQTTGVLAAPETRTAEAISPELLVAGQVFEKAYRKLLCHRSSPKMSSREAAYHNHFELCLERSKVIQWPVGSVYKPRYLGVVPHVLLCLQLALEYLDQEKAAVKEGIKKARHTELEKAQERYENAVKLSTTTKKLQSQLESSSTFHTANSSAKRCKELSAAVKDVEGLLGLLPRHISEQVNFNMYMAKEPPKKRFVGNKPRLNMGSELEDWEV